MSLTPTNKRAVVSTLVVIASTCAVLLSGQGQSAPQGSKVTIDGMHLSTLPGFVLRLANGRDRVG